MLNEQLETVDTTQIGRIFLVTSRRMFAGTVTVTIFIHNLDDVRENQLNKFANITKKGSIVQNIDGTIKLQ